MLKLIGNRLLQMLLIMAVVSLVIFAIFDSDKFKRQIAVAELGGFSVSALSGQDYENWLDRKGPNVPFYERYLKWVGGAVAGGLGRSLQKNAPGSRLRADPPINTGIPALSGVP